MHAKARSRRQTIHYQLVRRASVNDAVRAGSCDRNDRRLSSMLLIRALEFRPSEFTEPLFPIDRS
ncbi:hypothetical protein CGZ80_03515 [Rhodopirellula sp. MGV]|nr:hypothetical protein CGZ80_03515 [Rhodopirellula sp. MGV]